MLLRSFAIVIQQLPIELRDPVCIFYLVLRALDTVEDDMAIPAPDKLPTLISFHEKIFDRCEVQRAFQCLRPAVCNTRSSVQNNAGISNHSVGMVLMSDS